MQEITLIEATSQDISELICIEKDSTERTYSAMLTEEDWLADLIGKYTNYNFSLVTHPDNPAVFLYQSLGFKVLERIENYFGDGEPRLKLFLKSS